MEKETKLYIEQNQTAKCENRRKSTQTRNEGDKRDAISHSYPPGSEEHEEVWKQTYQKRNSDT